LLKVEYRDYSKNPFYDLIISDMRGTYPMLSGSDDDWGISKSTNDEYLEKDINELINSAKSRVDDIEEKKRIELVFEESGFVKWSKEVTYLTYTFNISCWTFSDSLSKRCGVKLRIDGYKNWCWSRDVSTFKGLTKDNLEQTVNDMIEVAKSSVDKRESNTQSENLLYDLGFVKNIKI
jgi:hypothetical protein